MQKPRKKAAIYIAKNTLYTWYNEFNLKKSY